METPWSNSLLFIIVLLAHGAALATAALWPQEVQRPDTLPTISGVLINTPAAAVVQAPAAVATPVEPKPVETPQPKPAPKPVQKPQPEPTPEPAPKQQLKKASIAPEPEPQTLAEEAAPPPVATVAERLNASEGAPVTAPRVDARHHQNPAPSYPRLSRRRGEEGTVVLELLVLKDGTVDEIKVKQSSGFPRLDRSAMEAVKRWKYDPATRGGQAIDYRYLQPVTFNLKG